MSTEIVTYITSIPAVVHSFISYLSEFNNQTEFELKSQTFSNYYPAIVDNFNIMPISRVYERCKRNDMQ